MVPFFSTSRVVDFNLMTRYPKDMSMNRIYQEVAKRRWLRRLNLISIPPSIWIKHQGRSFNVNPHDWRGPSYHVLNWGIETYEAENVGFVRRYFKQIDQDPCFFDIGSNIGIFSYFLALDNPNIEIHGFEPEPHTFSILKKNFDSFEKSNLRANNMGLSEKSGYLTLFMDEQNGGGHSLHKESILEEGNPISNEIQVEVSTLDNYVSSKSITKIDFIKMDVQRHEHLVLSGGQKTIQNYRPVVLMECYFEDLLKESSGLTLPFQEGYEIIDLRTPEKTYKPNQRELSEIDQSQSAYCDLIFCPSEKLSEVKRALLGKALH